MDVQLGPGRTWLRKSGFPVSISIPAVLADLIGKGSVTVDGVYLTVVTVDAEGFTVALVPPTLEVTTLGTLKPGARVNLEADPVGKWVRKILAETAAGPARPAVTREMLEEEGF